MFWVTIDKGFEQPSGHFINQRGGKGSEIKIERHVGYTRWGILLWTPRETHERRKNGSFFHLGSIIQDPQLDLIKSPEPVYTELNYTILMLKLVMVLPEC